MAPMATRRSFLALAVLALAACAGAPQRPPARIPAVEVGGVIHVVGHGWHAGLVLPAAALRGTGRVPELGDLPASPYVEFGWGDRAFYPAPDPGLADALAAALAPGPAVLRVEVLAVPFDPAAASRVRAIAVSPDAMVRLVAAIDASFDRGGAPRAAPIPEGARPTALFYPAHGRFHLFNTCNSWVARMLGEAGLPVSDAGVATVADLWRALGAGLGAPPP